MTFDEIKQLLEVVREHELSEFELEREGFKIRVRKQPVGTAGSRPRGARDDQGPAPVAAGAAASAPGIHGRARCRD